MTNGQIVVFCILVVLSARLTVAQETQTCDITAFQGSVSAPDGPYPASACQTCVFPTYARVNGLDTTKILQVDLSNKWIYFLGDSTTKQLHEQFLAYLDEPQVLCCSVSDCAFHAQLARVTSIHHIIATLYCCRRPLCTLVRKVQAHLSMIGLSNRDVVTTCHHHMTTLNASRTS